MVASAIGASPALDAAIAEIVTGEIVSDDGLVTIDLDTGDIRVDLQQVHGGDLSGLDPNTPLLDGATLVEITNTIDDLLGNVVNDVTTSLLEGLSAASVTVDIPLAIDLGTISTDTLLDLSVAELLSLQGLLGLDLGALGDTIADLGDTLDQALPLGDVLQTLFDVPIVGAILEGTIDLVLQDIVSQILNAVPSPLATVEATATISLAELLDDDTNTDGIAVTFGEVSLIGDTTDQVLTLLGVGELGALLDSTVAPLVEGLVETLVENVVVPLTDQMLVVESTLNGILDPLLTDTLAPLFAGLPNVLSVTINHQPTLLGDDDYFMQKLGYTGDRAFTVNALNVQVLAGAAEPLLDLSLASSSVRAIEYVTGITVDPSEVEQGDTTTVTGTGYEPGETVTGTMFSTPYDLGTQVANALGQVTFTWTFQAEHEVGEHTVELVGETSGMVSDTFDVVAAGGALAPTGGETTTNVMPIAVIMMLAGAVLFALTRRVKDVVHAE